MISKTILLISLFVFVQSASCSTDEVISVDSVHHLSKRQLPFTTTSNTTSPNTTVCYNLLGCFNNNDPFNNAALEVPQSPDIVSTAFLLFTQENKNTPEFISYDDTDNDLLKSSINPNRWLRIIIHGFTNNRDSVWIKPLKDELMKLTDDMESDVLVIDWGQGAKFPAYPTAVANTRLVGKQIGVLLEKLNKLKGLKFDQVHCIGHSLGAHTCGYASNAIDNQMNRISGLDPAGPLFAGKKTTVRLDKDDAGFVDVIHTNTDIALGLGLGTAEECGHIDFYPNGGQSQPGCPTVSQLLSGALTGQSEAAFEQASCSHGRAYVYFTESINSDCSYTSFPCHDYNSFVNGKCLVCPAPGCAFMGFNSIYSLARGKVFISTKKSNPFCGTHYFVEIIIGQDMPKTTGDIIVGVYSNYGLIENITMTPKANADIRSGDILRHVLSYGSDLSRIDYVIVTFNRMRVFLGFGASNGEEIVLSRVSIRSLEDSTTYSALCEKSLSVKNGQPQTVLMNRHGCHD